MDHELKTMTIICPNCGEYIQILVNEEDEGDTYIEDCEVCCSPINITVIVDEGDELRVEVHNDDDVHT